MGEQPSAAPLSSPIALVICYPLFASPFSPPARVERRLLAGAVALERALFADGVGALENPVLPRGEASEDFRFHGLGAAEAQIGFEPRQAVGGKACALLQKHADLVLPVDVVERDRKSTRLNSSHSQISYAVFCLKKKQLN